MEELNAQRRGVDLEDCRAVERGARLEADRGTGKAVGDATAEQKRVAEHEGLSAAGDFDGVFTQ